jgi:hypothetical protein
MQDKDTCLAFRRNGQAWSKRLRNLKKSAVAEPESRCITFTSEPVSAPNKATMSTERLDLMILRTALDAPAPSLSQLGAVLVVGQILVIETSAIDDVRRCGASRIVYKSGF